MNDEIKEILKHLTDYLQMLIDSGTHKIFYNDDMYDEKTIDCINAINDTLDYITNLQQAFERSYTEEQVDFAVNGVKEQLKIEKQYSNQLCNKIDELRVKNYELQQINNNQAKRNSRQRLANQKQQDLILKLQQLEQEHKKINGELRKENSKLEIALQNIQEDYDRRIEEIDVLKKKLDRRYYKNECKRLEQENERLKKNQRLSPEERQHFHLDIDEIYEILIDYKSRCEKAVEYINMHYLNANEPDLLNILQNGSDSQ